GHRALAAGPPRPGRGRARRPPAAVPRPGQRAQRAPRHGVGPGAAAVRRRRRGAGRAPGERARGGARRSGTGAGPARRGRRGGHAMSEELLRALVAGLLTLAVNACLLFALVALAERRFWIRQPARAELAWRAAIAAVLLSALPLGTLLSASAEAGRSLLAIDLSSLPAAAAGAPAAPAGPAGPGSAAAAAGPSAPAASTDALVSAAHGADAASAVAATDRRSQAAQLAPAGTWSLP